MSGIFPFQYSQLEIMHLEIQRWALEPRQKGSERQCGAGRGHPVNVGCFGFGRKKKKRLLMYKGSTETPLSRFSFFSLFFFSLFSYDPALRQSCRGMAVRASRNHALRRGYCPCLQGSRGLKSWHQCWGLYFLCVLHHWAQGIGTQQGDHGEGGAQEVSIKLLMNSSALSQAYQRTSEMNWWRSHFAGPRWTTGWHTPKRDVNIL